MRGYKGERRNQKRKWIRFGDRGKVKENRCIWEEGKEGGGKRRKRSRKKGGKDGQ